MRLPRDSGGKSTFSIELEECYLHCVTYDKTYYFLKACFLIVSYLLFLVSAQQAQGGVLSHEHQCTA